MKAFQSFTGVVASIERANIDTDQLLPKQYLTSVSRAGFGEALFRNWRFLPDGRLNPDFVLNVPKRAGASILVAGHNFGCGSSREHAVWALMQYGFRAVVAPWEERGDGNGYEPAFAEIFAANALANGLLLMELPPDAVRWIFAEIRPARTEGTVNLPEQTFTLNGRVFPFEIAPAAKERLLKGLDEIGATLAYAEEIAAYERKQRTFPDAP